MKWLKRLIAGSNPNDPEKNLRGNATVIDLPNVEDLSTQEPDMTLDLTDPKVIASFKEVSESIHKKQPTCPLKSGGLLLLDPADIKSVFSNKLFSNQPSRFSALAPKNKNKHTAAAVAANIPPFLDAPEHMEVRRWLSKAFFARLKQFDPDINRISAQQLAKNKVDHQYLLVEELARQFVTQTMIEFVGISGPTDNIKDYTLALFRLFAPAKNAQEYQKTNEALQQARAGILQSLQLRRADQSQCLLNIMDQTPVDFFGTQQHKDLMIADNALLILADGMENVEAAIGLVIMRWFEQNTSIDTSTGTSTDTISTDFVRDCIRQDTPGQTIPRIAAKDMIINGEKVAAGTPVFLSLASANSQSESGEDYNFGEDYSFGRGRHRCIGEQLAISMITVFCNDLIKMHPTVDKSGLVYAPMFGHKWPREVKVTLTASADR